MKRILSIIILLSFFSCKRTPVPSKQTVKNYTGTLAENAMVVTAHAEASRVGVEILKQGGNAIDASVAVQLALTVTYPIAGNIGGGGFMVYRDKDGKTTTLDFREKAPKKAHRDMYLDENNEVIPRLSLDGHLAVGVPGTIDGCVRAHKKYGVLPWETLVQPAIDLAANGFILTHGQATKFNKYDEKLSEFSEINYLAGNWKGGDTIRQPQLAATLTRIKEKGRAGFYEGKTAELFLKEMEKGGGIITADDLKNYKSVWREPIIGTYKDYKVISMPPPSSGGIILLQLLKMIENQPIREWGFLHPNTIHWMTEAERRAYADRSEYLGDPDFVNIPTEALLNESYLKKRTKNIEKKKATPSKEILPGLENYEFTQKNTTESEETTHFSIVDQWGNAVSITTTLNGAYGSKVFVKDAGFLLNNEMDDFSAKPGVPNLYGLVGNEANAIAPEKRMLSSMTPTILEKDGELFMVVGTPGGSTIITSVFQSILNVVEHNMSMQEAVNAPRFHHQWKPDTVYVEKGCIEPKVRLYLTKQGYEFVERSPIGKVDAILVRKNGVLEGGADIRGEDKAVGF